MRVLGLDIGSRSVDAVWVEDGRIVDWAVADSGHDPRAAAAAFVERGAHHVLVSTGYGRHAACERFGGRAVTEITAYGLGASALFPHAATVLDIGGQDTKVIVLAQGGKVANFEMNDKCAAGTGKFLEVMARALGYSLEKMGEEALGGESGLVISSMCTVFAESEVVGLVHRGEDRARIARGLHDSIAARTLAMLTRVSARGPLVFAGGVAKNPAMVSAVRAGFAGSVEVPEEAQIVGAYGAALGAVRG